MDEAEVRVLIVHAEPGVRITLRSALETGSPECVIRVLDDSRGALEVAREFQPRVLILGDHFPRGPSGAQTGMEVRGEPAISSPGILMVMSELKVGSAWRALLGPADLCLPLESLTPSMLRESVLLLAAGSDAQESTRVEFGPVVIDQAVRTAHSRGRLLDLDPEDFDALRRLVLRPGYDMSHCAMLGLQESERSDKVVALAHTRACNIRTALGPDASLLRTVRGHGYTAVANWESA